MGHYGTRKTLLVYPLHYEFAGVVYKLHHKKRGAIMHFFLEKCRHIHCATWTFNIVDLVNQLLVGQMYINYYFNLICPSKKRHSNNEI